ncbi:MAG TPA: glycoside hydrolase family 19 protein [Caulobacterales bacterium]|nr:glycoside hydrolase family 19 protein [Caulobacterales bacterium]
MIALSLDDIRRLAPSGKAEYLAMFEGAQETLAAAGILDNPRRLAHFMAQVMAETGGLNRVTENLNYSAAQLRATWPGRFPSDEFAKDYEHNREKIANYVYGGRMDNTQPGDGYKYRGRGLLQITGRENYTKFGPKLGLDLVNDPEQAIAPAHALKLAAAIWSDHRYHGKGCNEMADADDVVGVTNAINGGEIGLDQREQWLAKAKPIWAAAAQAAPAVVAAPEPPAPAPAQQPPPQQQASQQQASQQQAPQQPQQAPAPQQVPAPHPRQRGGSVIGAVLAFFAGAFAFLHSLFRPVADWIDAQRDWVMERYHFDPALAVAGLFVLAILFLIFVRIEHHGRVRKAAGA